MPTASVPLQRLVPQPAPLVPTRMRRLGADWLLTNDFGNHAFVPADQLDAVLAGHIAPDSELGAVLRAGHFWVDGLDVAAVREQIAHRLRFLRVGPTLHVLVVTLRCNHTCLYCHASRARMDETATDMSRETAERCVDLALQTTAPGLTLEFQGGEPLANWPVVAHVIEYATLRNETVRKALTFALVTNLSLMDDAKLDFLIDHRVQICTSLDGPADLHDAGRVWKGGASHATTVHWMRRIDARMRALGLDPSLYHVEALPTITRPTLARAAELIDHYVEVGCRSIFLRHLDPFGFAASVRGRLGYDMAEFLAFYADAYAHVVELNRRGIDFVERNAALLAAKILGHHEPNFLDLRSPCGAGIGQVAYQHDGRVFTCDEGRMIDRAGDATFCIGDARTSTLRDAILHPTTRAMVLASTLDGQPGCATCAYKPWCGVCPVHSYVEQGSLHGRQADASWCRKWMGIFDFFLTRVRHADAFERALLERWATPRPQEHYVHGADPA